MVSDFHKLSTESVNTEGLLSAIMSNPKMGIASLNAMFTDKHGGKAAILASMWEEFRKNKVELDKVGGNPNFAKDKADEIMGGLGGSFERLKGSVENLHLSIGNAHSSWLAPSFDFTSGVMDSFSNLSAATVATTSSVAGLGAAYLAYKNASAILGRFSLTGSATALNGSAAALTRAAVLLGAKGVIPPVVPIAGPGAGILARIGLGGAAGVTGLAVGGVLGAGALLEAARPTSPEGHPYRNMTFDRDAHGIYERSRRAQMELKQGTDMEGARGRAFAKLPSEGADAGTQAGAAAGQGIASGLQSAAGGIALQAEAIYESVRAKFSNPISINVQVKTEGLRGVHADAGVSP